MGKKKKNVTHNLALLQLIFVSKCFHVTQIIIVDIVKMNDENEVICGICFNVASDVYEVINEFANEMFAVGFLAMNLEMYKNLIICHICTQKVKEFLDFKSVFLKTEKRILTFAVEKQQLTFEVNDVIGSNALMTFSENFCVCRFCTAQMPRSNFVSMDSLWNNAGCKEIWPLLIPEVDINIIKNPMICTLCREKLGCYFNLIINYLNVGIDDISRVNLSEIPQHSSFSSHLQLGIAEQNKDTLDNEHYEELNIKYVEVKSVELTVDQDTQNKMYKCPKCHFYATKSEKCLKRHVLSHEYTANKSKIFKCTICTFETRNRGQLDHHTMLHEDVPETKLYKCVYCPYGTNCESSLTSHELIHRAISEAEPYKCTHCTFKTKFKGGFKIHWLTHNKGNRPTYKCAKCPYESKSKSHFSNHILTHKGIAGVKWHKCTLCNFVTIYKKSLRNHMITHKDDSEVNTYKCTICKYETKHKGSLKGHLLTHKTITECNALEIPTFKCTECSYEARSKCLLNKHVLTHKDITEVEAHKCTLCNFVTKYKQNLQNHMITHKDRSEVNTYKCAVCGHETKYKDGLKTHMLTHRGITEVETYKCTMCTFTSKRKPSCNRHMLTHMKTSEVRMYKCTICTYETRLKSNLQRHTKQIHKNNLEVKTESITKLNE